MLGKSNIFKGLSLFFLLGSFQQALADEVLTRAKECPSGDQMLRAYGQFYSKHELEFHVKTENIKSSGTWKDKHPFQLDKKKSEKLPRPDDVNGITLKKEDKSSGSQLRCHYNVIYLKKKWIPTKKLLGKVYDKSVNHGEAKSLFIIESR